MFGETTMFGVIWYHPTKTTTKNRLSQASGSYLDQVEAHEHLCLCGRGSKTVPWRPDFTGIREMRNGSSIRKVLFLGVDCDDFFVFKLNFFWILASYGFFRTSCEKEAKKTS